LSLQGKPQLKQNLDKIKNKKRKVVCLMTKLTKRDYFKMLAEVVSNNQVENAEELQNFINHELELLDKKSASRSSGDTAKQKENAHIKEMILDALIEINRPVTITELQNENERMKEFSNQKLSALLKQLVDVDKKVAKAVDKKKSYFTVVE